MTFVDAHLDLDERGDLRQVSIPVLMDDLRRPMQEACRLSREVYLFQSLFGWMTFVDADAYAWAQASTAVFQSLFGWMTFVDECHAPHFSRDMHRFQSLFGWMTFVDSMRRTNLPGGTSFQSLFGWMTFVDSQARC